MGSKRTLLHDDTVTQPQPFGDGVVAHVMRTQLQDGVRVRGYQGTTATIGADSRGGGRGIFHFRVQHIPRDRETALFFVIYVRFGGGIEQVTYGKVRESRSALFIHAEPSVQWCGTP